MPCERAHLTPQNFKTIVLFQCSEALMWLRSGVFSALIKKIVSAGQTVVPLKTPGYQPSEHIRLKKRMTVRIQQLRHTNGSFINLTKNWWSHVLNCVR